MIDHDQKHLMRLILRDRGEDGWAKVSQLVWPLVSSIPDALVEKKPTEDGGFVKLTHDGETVLAWM